MSGDDDNRLTQLKLLTEIKEQLATISADVRVQSVEIQHLRRDADNDAADNKEIRQDLVMLKERFGRLDERVKVSASVWGTVVALAVTVGVKVIEWVRG